MRAGRGAGTARGAAATLTVAVLLGGLLAGCGSGASKDAGAARSRPAPSATSLAAVRAAARLQPCPRPGAAADTGRRLPDLTVGCLGGGEPVALDRLTGTPTVVNLWASYCAPCRQETPALQAVAARSQGRLRVLGLASEDVSAQASLAFMTAAGAHYPSLVDTSGRVRRSLGLPGLPGTALLRPDGTIAKVLVGPVSQVSLAAAVHRYLGVTI